MIVTGKKEKDAKYYDEAYKKAAKAYNVSWKNSRYLKMFEAVERMLPQDKNIPIIDVGCGCGQLTAMLLDLGYTNVIGFDYSETAIQTAKKLFPNYEKKFFKLDLNNFEAPTNSIVLLTEVLEHIEKDLEVVKKYAPTNVLILSVPTFDDPAHVRYFTNAEDVMKRYHKYLNAPLYTNVGPWIVMGGNNMNF